MCGVRGGGLLWVRRVEIVYEFRVWLLSQTGLDDVTVNMLP